MSFVFPPLALFTQPPVGLLASLHNEYKVLPLDKGSGVVGIELRANKELSIALEPDRWKLDSTGVMRPARDHPLAIAYEMPPQLYDAEATVCLIERERGKGNTNVVVVGDYEGAPLRCLKVDSARAVRQGDWHVRATFAGKSLSRVVWSFPQEKPRCRFSIARARLTQEGNQFVVRREIVVSFHVARLEDVAPRLIDDFEKWRSAVDALAGRLQCGGCKNAHYGFA